MSYNSTKNAQGRFNGPDLSTGYYPQAKKPFDVRTVVDTVANMYKIMQTYPSMKVTVLGPMVLNGTVETYPNAVTYECIADVPPNGAGDTTNASHWRPIVGGFAINGGYKGAYDAVTNTPALKAGVGAGDANRAALQPGDYYRVSVAATGITGLDGITELGINDAIFWNGTDFDKYEYTEPIVSEPLYTDTEGAQFQTDVKDLIYAEAIKYWSNEAIKAGQVRLDKYTNAGGAEIIDMWRAKADMTVDTNDLPTTRKTSPGVNNVNWELIGTTAGGVLIDDTAGTAATGTYADDADAAGRSTTKTLSPQEIDARIKQYSGKSTVLQGGTPTSFETADLTEGAKD